MSDFIERWSPNFDERALPIAMIVLHYTGMKTGAEALDRLADPDAKVSAHYVVSEDGQITHMAVSYTHLDVYKRQPSRFPIPTGTSSANSG